jgi:hypothetical protein
MKLYLDNCCFNRPFDDQSHLRIRLEAEAKMRIQEEILSGSYDLVWSYLLNYKNSKNPFRERREQIAKWRGHSGEYIEESEELLGVAKVLLGHGLKKIDALHVACAIVAGADFFLTTDDGILKKAALVRNIKINDLIGFIKETLA